jgi:hypothetical protein
MKKIFLLLTAVLTAGMLSAETIYGDCGTNMEWEFNTGSGALYLIGTGPMDDYTSFSETPWAQYKDQIKSIQTDSRSQYTTIGDYAFAGCKNLTSVDLPNTVTKISGYAFDNCTGLTSVTIPNSVTSIGEKAFQGCTGLKTIIIPASVQTIGTAAFSNCVNLTVIQVSAINPYYSAVDGVLYNKNKTILHQFPAGKNVTSFDIPNTVTEISGSAFEYCRGLTSVTIPNSVTSIGKNAFSRCTGLTTITCKAVNPPALGEDVFYNVNTTIPLYVPAQSVSAYLAAEQWKVFDVKEAQGIEGALPGRFTINENGDQVQFAQGNLQYQPSTGKWRFAPNQYTVLLAENENITNPEYTGWLDLFAWGTGNNPMKLSLNDADYTIFTDWGSNPIENGGNTPNEWRTLSKKEWDKLFDWDGMAMANVCGMDGYIYLPDNWELPSDLTFVTARDAEDFSANTYNPTEWAKMEAAGALFLPVCGYGRYETYWDELRFWVATLSMGYWTCDSYSQTEAYVLIQKDVRNLTMEWSRRAFFGVRLVRDINTEGIEQPTSDSSLKGRANKVIKDGQLYIERNGKTYNAQGAEVK